MKFQFRWELYSAWNHTQFSGLDTTARFDTATGQQVNARFGGFTGVRSPRIMQLALRFYSWGVCRASGAKADSAP